MKNNYFYFILFCLFILPTYSFAESSSASNSSAQSSGSDAKAQSSSGVLPSGIHFSEGGDSLKGRNSQLSGVYYTDDNTHFNLDLGSSHIKDSSTQNVKTSSNFSVAVGSDPTQFFSGGVRFEVWGLKDAIAVSTVKLPLAFDFEQSDFKLYITPGVAQIKLPDVTIGARTFEMKAQDSLLGVGMDYSLSSDWELSFSYEKHNFDKDLTRLSSQRASFIFSEQTLNLAASLMNYKASLGITHYWDTWSLGFELYKSESAFDKSVQTGSALFADYDINRNWYLDGSVSRSTLSAGIQPLTADQKEPVKAFTLGVGYKF